MAQLILIRHGQSIWNALNKFTGCVDVPLSQLGREEAKKASHKLNQYRVDVGFASLLIRALETAVICLTECEEICGGKTPIIKHEIDDPDWQGWDQYQGDPSQELPIFINRDLDERYYGELQGLNKAETAEKFGEQQVHQWRRSFSTRPPGGESLADTAARTLPYFHTRILPPIRAGKNVMVAAHGNSLRSIIMELDKLSEEAVTELEIATGIPIIYEMNEAGEVVNKTILK